MQGMGEIGFGRLHARNPYIGYLKHAPRGEQALAARVLDGQVLTPVEHQRAKANRHNVHTGIFHKAPGVFSDLHVKFLNARVSHMDSGSGEYSSPIGVELHGSSGSGGGGGVHAPSEGRPYPSSASFTSPGGMSSLTSPPLTMYSSSGYTTIMGLSRPTAVNITSTRYGGGAILPPRHSSAGATAPPAPIGLGRSVSGAFPVMPHVEGAGSKALPHSATFATLPTHTGGLLEEVRGGGGSDGDGKYVGSKSSEVGWQHARSTMHVSSVTTIGRGRGIHTQQAATEPTRCSGHHGSTHSLMCSSMRSKSSFKTESALAALEQIDSQLAWLAQSQQAAHNSRLITTAAEDAARSRLPVPPTGPITVEVPPPSTSSVFHFGSPPLSSPSDMPDGFVVPQGRISRSQSLTATTMHLARGHGLLAPTGTWLDAGLRTASGRSDVSTGNEAAAPVPGGTTGPAEADGSEVAPVAAAYGIPVLQVSIGAPVLGPIPNVVTIGRAGKVYTPTPPSTTSLGSAQHSWNRNSPGFYQSRQPAARSTVPSMWVLPHPGPESKAEPSEPNAELLMLKWTNDWGVRSECARKAAAEENTGGTEAPSTRQMHGLQSAVPAVVVLNGPTPPLSSLRLPSISAWSPLSQPTSPALLPAGGRSSMQPPPHIRVNPGSPSPLPPPHALPLIASPSGMGGDFMLPAPAAAGAESGGGVPMRSHMYTYNFTPAHADDTPTDRLVEEEGDGDSEDEGTHPEATASHAHSHSHSGSGGSPHSHLLHPDDTVNGSEDSTSAVADAEAPYEFVARNARSPTSFDLRIIAARYAARVRAAAMLAGSDAGSSAAADSELPAPLHPDYMQIGHVGGYTSTGGEGGHFDAFSFPSPTPNSADARGLTFEDGDKPGGGMGLSFQWPSFQFLASPAIVDARRRADSSGSSESLLSGAASPHAHDAFHHTPGAALSVTGGGTGVSVSVGAPSTRPRYLLSELIGAKRTPIADDYELGPVIGDGGYACVRTARLKRSDVPCADNVVKCVRKRFLLSDEEKDSVTREVEIHRSISHPHIVSLIDTYEDEKEFVYLVLEKVRGGDLQSYIRVKCVRQFSEAQTRLVMDQLLSAVEYLHAHGILHADIKPSNILLAELPLSDDVGFQTVRRDQAVGGASGTVQLYLSPGVSVTSTSSQASGAASSVVSTGGTTSTTTIATRTRAGTATNGTALKTFIQSVKLCDFGAARRSRDARYYRVTGDVGLVPWTSVQGTMGYIAPEILNRKHYGTPVDIWSLGILMYELLAGYAPFYPYSQCLSEAVIFPDNIWSHISPEACALCQSMLVQDPKYRMTAHRARAHPWFAMHS